MASSKAANIDDGVAGRISNTELLQSTYFMEGKWQAHDGERYEVCRSSMVLTGGKGHELVVCLSDAASGVPVEIWI